MSESESVQACVALRGVSAGLWRGLACQQTQGRHGARTHIHTHAQGCDMHAVSDVPTKLRMLRRRPRR